MDILGLNAFATAYDPLDLAADSIDPLGFLRAYLALADRMLPGFTTVTGTPRYLPMLCAGIHAAERLHPRDEAREPAKARGRRLEVLCNFEKVWALSCGLALETRGDAAIEGLRGISYVKRFLQTNSSRSEISIERFELLQNQVRYGGIGAYGQMLEACHFVDWATLTLRPLGEALADTFVSPTGWIPERPYSRVAKESLRDWGETVCLEKITAKEASVIRKGLKGDLEAERDDDVRWHCLCLLAKAGAESESGSEKDCLLRFRSLVDREPVDNARKAAAVRQLRVIASLVEPLERFYQSVIFIFDEVRAVATETDVGCKIVSLNASNLTVEALDVAKSSERALRKAFADAIGQDAQVSAAVESDFCESGISGLASSIESCSTVAEAVVVLLKHHAAVQSGKHDRGQQKSPWLRLDHETVSLVSQRNELPRNRHVESWRGIARHPYRTSPAAQFIKHCRIS